MNKVRKVVTLPPDVIDWAKKALNKGNMLELDLFRV